MAPIEMKIFHDFTELNSSFQGLKHVHGDQTIDIYFEQPTASGEIAGCHLFSSPKPYGLGPVYMEVR